MNTKEEIIEYAFESADPHEEIFRVYEKAMDEWAKQQNEELIDVLTDLVQLKEWKDKNGKDEHYLKHQPEVWVRAKQVLKKQKQAAMKDALDYLSEATTGAISGMEALVSYAKQQSIEFAKWIVDEGWGFLRESGHWYSVLAEKYNKITTEELYTQFTEHQLLKENNQ